SLPCLPHARSVIGSSPAARQRLQRRVRVERRAALLVGDDPGSVGAAKARHAGSALGVELRRRGRPRHGVPATTLTAAAAAAPSAAVAPVTRSAVKRRSAMPSRR
ncbi:unnamed protein product, partial [Urochloa humidicola]